MTGTSSPAPPTQWPAWKVGGATILTFVALLYLIELVDQLTGQSLEGNGIKPLEADGLRGILFAPLLHGGWDHLLANTVPALVLGFLVTLAGMARFVWATAIIWILGGLGTWLIGNIGSCQLETNHIGGWLAFLLVCGWLTRNLWQIGVSLVVLLVYGGILWGAVPVLNRCGGVSWQGHLCGAVAGVLAAYWLSSPQRAARARKKAAPPLPGTFA